MAKFECVGTPDLVVGTGRGAIKFRDYAYTTTIKAEIALLSKAKNVKEVGKAASKKEAVVDKLLK